MAVNNTIHANGPLAGHHISSLLILTSQRHPKTNPAPYFSPYRLHRRLIDQLNEQKKSAILNFMNEQEAILHNFKHLDFCKMLTTDGIITLDEMSELLPGTFSILDLDTCTFEYASTRMLHYFQKTMGDIIAEGADFTRGMGDLKSTQIVMQNISTFLLQNEPDKMISSFLRLRPSPKEDLRLFLVTAKSYENTNRVLIFSQRLDQLEPYSFAKEIFDFRYDFFNAHYLQFSSLTKREKEILAFVADGMSSSQIAERLGISIATISTHRQNIIRKLGTGKLVDLIKYAIAFGLVKH